jgi:hypothetical protein
MDKDSTTTTEEQPKAVIAKAVVINKKQYFIPTTGESIAAESIEKALAKSESNKSTNTKDEKVGDA